MVKVAVIGDRDSIYGFASVGMDIFPAEDPVEAVRTLRRIVASGYGVVFITEGLAGQMEAEIDSYRDVPVPAVILIPGLSGNTGKGLSNLSKSVERAVGMNILGD